MTSKFVTKRKLPNKAVKIIYILKKNNYYVKVCNNKPTLISNVTQATKYLTSAQAENFIKNNIKGSDKVNYIVSKLETQSNETKDNSVLDDLKSMTKQFATKYSSKKAELSSIIQKCDKIILDIRHFARDNSTRLNACQAAKTFYKQQQIERERLEAKTELSRILEVERQINKAISVADKFEFGDYKPREIKDMSRYIGL